MSPLQVVTDALTAGSRAASVGDLAELVVDALVTAGLLTPPARRCSSLLAVSADRPVRCFLPHRHPDLHNGHRSSTTDVTWADSDALGVIRERT